MFFGTMYPKEMDVSFLGTTGDESVPGATVCARQLHTGRYPRSPDWLQLRTGYILSSGSLSTVPKRESDDYSCGARGARGKEKGEKMVGRVNACTKARLCIGIKDVFPHLFRFFFSFPSLSFFPFYFNPTTSSGTHRQHSLRPESHT